jgi:acyl-CoA thioesterase YciA
MPAGCSANGDIFDGWVMAQVDLAFCRPACRRPCATVAVNEFVFKQPVRVGDILACLPVSRISTSITVAG